MKDADYFADLFRGIPVLLTGARATASYAPERETHDADFLVHVDHDAEAQAALRSAGWSQQRVLRFPNAQLGLSGTAWSSPQRGYELDLIVSDQSWVRAAWDAPPVFDHGGGRVLPLAYLVLMKIDSSRAIDQGDLSRILALRSLEEIDEIVRIVSRHHPDHAAADDIRQYAEIGSWEYE